MLAAQEMAICPQSSNLRPLYLPSITQQSRYATCYSRLLNQNRKTSVAPFHGTFTLFSRPYSRTQSTIVQAMDRAEPGKCKVGFIGLGILGYPMTENLLKAGYQVTVWNRTESKSQQIAGTYEGVSVASSPGEVVAKSDIIISVLVDEKSYDAISSGSDGILAHMGPGKGFVDVSTVEAKTALRVAEDVRSRGALYLAAPVSGSKGPAETGTLIFMTGGDKELHDAALPLLEIMGKLSVYLGNEIEKASNMKIVVNMVMGSMMEALAEGMNLAESVDLDASDLIAILNNGAMACPMFQLKGPSMAKSEYPTAFPLKHQLKDMKFAVQLAEESKCSVPTAEVATKVFDAAAKIDLGDKDFSAVREVTRSK